MEQAHLQLEVLEQSDVGTCIVDAGASHTEGSIFLASFDEHGHIEVDSA